MSAARKHSANDRAVRRCLTQIRRSIPTAARVHSDGSDPNSRLLTAARRFAFLYLMEAILGAGRPGASLEQALDCSLADRCDRFYANFVIPRCSELLGPMESPHGPVPDAQFSVWMELFRTWNWSLVEGDEGDAATPELLCALCESSLDQKASGAYFTGPDVTAYICANVVLPVLVDITLRSWPGSADMDLLPGWGRPRFSERYLRLHHTGRLDSIAESERERASRVAHVERCRRSWNSGEIQLPDDWITWNLDADQILQDWVRETTDRAALELFYRALREVRVLDPTCGSGAFLIEALETLRSMHLALKDRLAEMALVDGLGSAIDGGISTTGEIVARNLFGVDQSVEAVETCRMRLLLRAAGETVARSPVVEKLRLNVRQGDVLLDDVFPEVAGSDRGFDAVIGNPPYVAYLSGGRYADAGYCTESSQNLYALVTERATKLLHSRGRLGMILPISSTSLPGFRPLAELLQQGNAWISSYSNRPAKLFQGVEQRLSIWITGPSQSPTSYVSAFQHWYAEERPWLFSRLTYVPASKWRGTNLPIKSGCRLAEDLFGKITTNKGQLAAFEYSEGEVGCRDEAVWLHDAPTYWIRALTFEPNPESRQEAGHYHRIAVEDGRRSLVLAAILSSTTFYFFFKMVSNCRDLGRKEWALFPMDGLTESQMKEMEILGEQLQDRLRETSRLRSRRYPRGVVTYREYYPARAKAILDSVDHLLAGHYGFTGAEVDYLLNYDLKYRMGQNDAG